MINTVGYVALAWLCLASITLLGALVSWLIAKRHPCPRCGKMNYKEQLYQFGCFYCTHNPHKHEQD